MTYFQDLVINFDKIYDIDYRARKFVIKVIVCLNQVA